MQAETEKVTRTFQDRAKIPGFRPGKAPASIIRKSFEGDIRQKVLENLVPRFFDAKAKEENIHIVGTPNIKEVHFHDGEPLHFKAEFETYPEFALTGYTGVEVPYKEPVVTEEDVQKRLDEIRDQKAQMVNEDPRPLADGDYAVISLESLAGSEEPIRSDEVSVLIAGPETMAGFTENLRGASPGDEKEIEVTYPEDYGQDKLAGKTVLFKVQVKGLRRKELPELTDEFAQDLGDFRTVDELKEALRKSIYAQRDLEAQRETKDKIVEKLVDAHEFAVPEVFVERQIENRVRQRLEAISQRGAGPEVVQSGLGQNERGAAGSGHSRSARFIDSFEGVGEGIDRTHQRRSRSRSGEDCPAGTGARRRSAKEARGEWNSGPDCVAYPDREDPEFPVRPSQQDG